MGSLGRGRKPTDRRRAVVLAWIAWGTLGPAVAAQDPGAEPTDDTGAAAPAPGADSAADPAPEPGADSATEPVADPAAQDAPPPWVVPTPAEVAAANAPAPLSEPEGPPPVVDRNDPRYDPHLHGLRLAVFPAFLTGAWSQTRVGTAVRADVDLAPRLSLAAHGRAGWASIGGDEESRAVLAGGSLRWLFIDAVVDQSASGTIYPRDVGIPPSADAIGTASGSDLQVPVAQRMGGPQMVPQEVDHDAIVPMRSVQMLRAGYDFVIAVQQGRDESLPEDDPLYENRMHVFHLGWAMGSHWNLPAHATGQRELGFKRGYVDVLVAPPSLANREALGEPVEGFDPSFMPVGIRLGLEGALDALIGDWEGLGFAYQLEGGSLPGYSGFEGYVHVALGAELDFATGGR